MSLIIKKFSASYCGPCKMLQPVFEEFKKTYNNVTFLEIDVEDQVDEASKYGVRSVPTVVLEKNGVEVERFVGVQSKYAYINSITENSK